MMILTHLLIMALATQGPEAKFSVDSSFATTPPGLSFRAGFAVSNTEDRFVEIYTRDAASEFVLRRSHSLNNAPTKIEWASSSTCPTIVSLVPAMERLPLGGLSIPDMIEEPAPRFVFPQPPMPPTDGPSYTVWGWGRQPDAALSAYQVSTSSGMIAAFVQQAEEALMPCWRANNE